MALELVTHLHAATDSEAVVQILPIGGDLPEGLAGTLVGPKCTYARTLPSEFAMETLTLNGAHRSKVLVTEPCYWTPELPFLYTLRAHWNDAAGHAQERDFVVGFRRLAPRGASLYWDSSRVVLRGARVELLQDDMVDPVRAADVALIVPRPTNDQCDLADRTGVALIADLRQGPHDVDELHRLSTRPAVAMLFVDQRRITADSIRQLAPRVLLAVDATDGQPPASWCDAIVFELDGDATLPERAVGAGKPVIAIRRGVAYADFHEARAACDRLQADLAPQFDLAGYFVAT